MNRDEAVTAIKELFRAYGWDKETYEPSRGWTDEEYTRVANDILDAIGEFIGE